MRLIYSGMRTQCGPLFSRVRAENPSFWPPRIRRTKIELVAMIIWKLDAHNRSEFQKEHENKKALFVPLESLKS